MEELTLANGNGNGAKQFSVRQNPQQYEHPEHWEHAREPNVFKRVGNGWGGGQHFHFLFFSITTSNSTSRTLYHPDSWLER